MLDPIFLNLVSNELIKPFQLINENINDEA